LAGAFSFLSLAARDKKPEHAAGDGADWGANDKSLEAGIVAPAIAIERGANQTAREKASNDPHDYTGHLAWTRAKPRLLREPRLRVGDGMNARVRIRRNRRDCHFPDSWSGPPIADGLRTGVGREGYEDEEHRKRRQCRSLRHVLFSLVENAQSPTGMAQPMTYWIN
jgi:hypothetical protein